MRYGFSAILLLLFFCLPPATSLAASKTLLRLGSFRQWADLSYGYAREDSSGPADVTEHRFEERYTLLGKYIVLNPRLWNGDFEFKIGLEQESTEEQTGRREMAGTETEYQVSGLLFSHRPASLALSALSRTMRRTQLNAPDYDLRTGRYKAALFLRNKMLPTRLTYLISTSETDGLSIDRRTEIDQFQAQTRNSLGPSQTELSLSLSRQRTDFSGETPSERSNSSDFGMSNRLEFVSPRRPGTLHSRLSHISEEGGDTENERLDWSENLDWRLGKALTSGLRYSLTRISGSRSETRTHVAGAFLQHQLFQSLVSRIDLSGQRQESGDGRQDDRRAALDLSYRKRLGERTGMTLGVGGGYGITDRKVEDGLRTVIGLDLAAQEVDNFLPDTGILPETVVVHSEDRTVVYLEGSDYLLQTNGEVTEIVIPLGSVIVPGQVLSIDYEFQIDPLVRYETRNFHSSGSLDLLNNRLQFFYQFAESRQDLLEGEASTQSFSDTRSLRVGVASHRDGHRFRLTYGNLRTATNPSEFVQGSWNYSGNLWRGRWAAQLIDTYTWYRAPESGGAGSQSNSLSASTTYSRRWGNKLLNTRAIFSNTGGRSVSRDKIAMEIEYALSLGKSQLSLTAGVDWDRYNGADSRSDRLQIRIRRFF